MNRRTNVLWMGLIVLGLGFGFPGAGVAWHETSCEVVEQCIREEKARQAKRGGLGIRIRVVEQKGDRPEPPFIAVDAVFDDGAAAGAGLQPGDGILALNGRELGERDAAFFLTFHRGLEIGTAVTYTILRQDDVLDVDMTANGRHPETVRTWIVRHLQQYHPRDHLEAFRAQTAVVD